MGSTTLVIAMNLLFFIFLFIGLSQSEETNNEIEGGERQKKLFSLFSVVTFPNDQCTAKSDTTMYGTCYTESECTSKGGSADGNCAAGFGVCCTITSSTCGSTVSQNCTYVQNPSYPTKYTTTGSCKWTVNPINDAICQLRLDFNNFDLTDASTGICTDSLTIGGPTGRNPMDLCGTATNQHIYVEQGRSTTATTLTFTIATGGTWKMKVTQIECYNLARANPDCNQWFTGLSGTFFSYNWPTLPLQAKSHNFCFRQELGYCSIDFNQHMPLTSPDSFAIDNTGTLSYNSGTWGEGFIDITGNDIVSHISGDIFSENTANHASEPSTVRSSAGNYILAYNTLAATQAGETGFKLVWTQVPCGQRN